jgi:hypothetical protein
MYSQVINYMYISVVNALGRRYEAVKDAGNFAMYNKCQIIAI